MVFALSRYQHNNAGSLLPVIKSSEAHLPYLSGIRKVDILYHLPAPKISDDFPNCRQSYCACC